MMRVVRVSYHLFLRHLTFINMHISLTNKSHVTDRGLKGTKPRMAVLHILEEEAKPMDVSEILEGLNKHKINVDQATVYRIVDSFFKRGLIVRVDFQEGKFRYERIMGPEHHHLICESCGKIEDITDCKIAEFQKNVSDTKGFLIKRHSLEFFGLCNNCQG